jgi:hypothetical protein
VGGVDCKDDAPMELRVLSMAAGRGGVGVIFSRATWMQDPVDVSELSSLDEARCADKRAILTAPKGGKGSCVVRRASVFEARLN